MIRAGQQVPRCGEKVKSMNRTIAFIVVAGLVMGCTSVGGKADQKTDIGRTEKGEAVIAAMLSSKTLSISIRCDPGKVYAFASNPGNLPKWAKGLGTSVKKHGADWIVDTPQGPVKVRFADKNTFGVLDQYVTTASGAEVYVPLRVLSNGPGSEVIFTLFRSPEMSDEKYAGDMKLVEQDLRTLKDILEK
jgi:hypothetical protein